MPVMKPFWSDLNLTPTLTLALSGAEATAGVGLAGQIVQGHAPPAPLTVTVTPAPGVSRFPLSSTARLLIVTCPEPFTVQRKVQDPRPVAGCQVVPPSTETSTPPTTPPVSDAVPVIVTWL